MKKRAKRWLAWVSGIALTASCAAAMVPVLNRGAPRAELEVARVAEARPAALSNPLTVATFNIAHGRALADNQVTVSEAEHRQNIRRIGQALTSEEIDLVALQEADGPSLWSGGFDHVDLLARESELAYYAAGAHVDGLGLAYGTAVLSRNELRDPVSVTFAPTWPTFSKGFVAVQVTWPGTDVTVDVVSLHLDYASHDARRAQLAELADYFEGRSAPRIVMGDFNCEWSSPDEALAAFAARLGLHTWAPEETLATFFGGNRRIDWILVSSELELSSHRVLTDELSDHRLVIAEVSLDVATQ